jgi:hypothetical protein
MSSIAPSFTGPTVNRRRTARVRAAILAVAAGIACALVPAAVAQALVGNSFTYQGELVSAGTPANGPFDFQFRLFNSLNAQVGPTVTVNDLAVTDGRFTTSLDFGDVYTGQLLGLDISVRPGASIGAYTTLTPRQPLAGTPYAQGVQLPLNQSATILGPLVDLTNQSTSNLAPVMRLTSGGASGNSVGIGFQPVLIADTNDGNGIASYTSAAGAFAVYARPEGSGSVGIVVDQASPSGRAALFRTLESANSTVAVEINHSGTGGGLSVSTTNTANASSLVSAVHTGTGAAGFFDNTNAAATRPTLDVESSAEGESIPSGTQDNGIAIKGQSTGAFGIGVMGRGLTAGVFGYSGTTGGAGVLGRTDGGGGSLSVGVRGEGNGSGTAGVAAFNNLGTALYGQTTTGAGVFGTNGGSNTTGFAGDFNGRVRVSGNLQVTGTVSKGAGSFKIDHPLDPENKFLYHSFVESPDMKNIYDGVATLDANGHATVTLPHYFNALNKDFRYQLTCIGGYAPVYIAREVADNSFEIAGGKPGLKVSWTVTGIRQDPYANTHRIPNEVEKSADEKGLYLYPEAYGQPETRRIGGAAQPTFVQPESAPN